MHISSPPQKRATCPAHPISRSRHPNKYNISCEIQIINLSLRISHQFPVTCSLFCPNILLKHSSSHVAPWMSQTKLDTDINQQTELHSCVRSYSRLQSRSVSVPNSVLSSVIHELPYSIFVIKNSSSISRILAFRSRLRWRNSLPLIIWKYELRRS